MCSHRTRAEFGFDFPIREEAIALLRFTGSVSASKLTAIPHRPSAWWVRSSQNRPSRWTPGFRVSARNVAFTGGLRLAFRVKPEHRGAQPRTTALAFFDQISLPCAGDSGKATERMDGAKRMQSPLATEWRGGR
jgi:hypothetical protein